MSSAVLFPTAISVNRFAQLTYKVYSAAASDDDQSQSNSAVETSVGPAPASTSSCTLKLNEDQRNAEHAVCAKPPRLIAMPQPFHDSETSLQEHELAGRSYGSPFSANLSNILKKKKKRHAEEGVCVDVHNFVLRSSSALDIFKGILVLLMTASHLMIALCSPQERAESFISLLVCNAASSGCFVGFMIAFGYASYPQYLREWPDPPDATERRARVFRACIHPILGAWVCQFAWCFVYHKYLPTPSTVISIFTFARVFGNGPDFLLGFSINLFLAYMLWGMLNKIHGSVQPGWRQDAVAVGLVLAPVLLTLTPVPDCRGFGRTVQIFLPCQQREIDSVNLAALPHLLDFGLGVLLACVKDRFISDLRPISNNEKQSTMHLLPWHAVRQWTIATAIVLFSMCVLFVPLGQVWFITDLGNVQVQTAYGWIIRGFAGGPSACWLLSTVWPVSMLAILSFTLAVAKDFFTFGSFMYNVTVLLEHLGANVLYYLIVGDILLAGMFRGFEQVDPYPLSVMGCLYCTIAFLAIGWCLHYMAKMSRK